MIIPPVITVEERERRIAEIKRVMWKIWSNIPYEKQLEIIEQQERKEVV